MLNTRCPGVQATRMLQQQNKKEANNTRMMCNEVPRGFQSHYTPSPPRTAKATDDVSPAAARPRPMLPHLMGNGASPSPSPSMSEGSLSPSRLPVLPPSSSRPASVVSPSRRTFHMSPNDRRSFYAQFVDRPSNATYGVSQQWRQ
uniref:Uncharacterized protein n=1 Tax=Neobodo designis TaxID=312471 RepID=A0A7S1QRY4_NEODS|mmetsp:Transcript_5107/g.16194  ORF Transcript_5107/g.16194 Transcript_5107/m.16194 type:complete len:145 (+) Transcript_5107:50-484(+)